MAPCSSTLPSFLTVVCILALVLTAATGQPRYVGVASDGPFSTAVSRNASVLADVRRVLIVLDVFAVAIDERVNSAHPRACNLHAPSWFDHLTDNVRHRNLSQLDDVCRTRLDLMDMQLSSTSTSTSTPSSSSSSSSSSMGLLTVPRIHRALKHAADGVAHAINSGTGIAPRRWPLSTWAVARGSQVCEVQTGGAFKQAGKWYVRLGVTSQHVDSFTPTTSRETLDEFAYFPSTDNGRPSVLTSMLQMSDGTSINASTMLSNAQGKAPFSVVAMPEHENAALEESFRITNSIINQAEDAVTISNLAILTLPVILVFIPFAFIAELNNCATVLYILFTDLFSTLPLLIKGVELYVAGSHPHGEASAFRVGNDSVAWLEVWSVQCKGSAKFSTVGIVLIVVSVSSIAVGCILEALAWTIMDRRRRQVQVDNQSLLHQGPFGQLYRSDSWFNVHPIQDDEYDADDHGSDDHYMRYTNDRSKPPLGAWGLRMLQRPSVSVSNRRDTPVRKRLKAIVNLRKPPAHPLSPTFNDSEPDRRPQRNVL